MRLSVNKSAISRFLEQAALSNQRRNSFIYKALHTFIQDDSLISSAFVWKNKENNNRNIIAVGLKEKDIFQWLHKYIFELSEYQLIINEGHSPLKDLNMNIFPVWNQDNITGIWVIWANKKLSSKDKNIAFVHPYLEAITVIDQPREVTIDSDVLDQELIEALQYKDPRAILAALSIFQLIGDADLVAWGDVINNTIMITSHLGSRQGNFGFEISVGEGLGGKTALMKSMLSVNDYRNCQYRLEQYSPTIDKEGVRSVVVLPLINKQIQTGGLLYLARREVRPFTLLQQLFLLKAIQSIEPLHDHSSTSKSFFVTSRAIYPLAHKKAELRDLIEQQKSISEIEKWASKTLKGLVIVTNPDGSAYNIERINQDFVGGRTEYPLLSKSGISFGKLLLITSIPLQQSNWPDFIEDLKSACRITLERQILLNRRDVHTYRNWLQSIIKKGINEDLYYLGLRFGFPVENGEVWLFSLTSLLPDYLQLQFEEIVFKMTQRKMIFYDHFILLLLGEDDKRVPPEKLRDELLKLFPEKIRLIYGATYDSFSEIKEAIEHSISFAKTARTELSTNFVLRVKQTELDILFRKEHMRKELEEFSITVLQPVIDYDTKYETTFTRTLAYNCLLRSPDIVADYLFIHKNTVLYRVKRAKEILNLNTGTPKNRIALELASYQWIKHEDPSFLTRLNNDNKKNEADLY